MVSKQVAESVLTTTTSLTSKQGIAADAADGLAKPPSGNAAATPSFATTIASKHTSAVMAPASTSAGLSAQVSGESSAKQQDSLIATLPFAQPGLSAFQQGCTDLTTKVAALADMRKGGPTMLAHQRVAETEPYNRPHTADEIVSGGNTAAAGQRGSAMAGTSGTSPQHFPMRQRPATDDVNTAGRSSPWLGMSMSQAAAAHASLGRSNSRHSRMLSPQHSSALSRPRSVAQLLGVDDVGVEDMISPQEVTLLSLDEFSALTTTDVEEALAAVANGEQCNLLASSPHMPPAMSRKLWSLNDFELVRHMHHGYVSDVVEARCRVTGVRVALKVYSLPDMSPLTRVQLLREMRLHLGLSHPNIVAMFAAFIEQGTLIEDAGGGGMDLRRARYNHVVIVQEFAEQGDLLRMLKRYGGTLPERVAVNEVLRPLLHALTYMHGRGVVHRDLKPGNVLFDRGGVLKLADFGLSIDLNEERASTRAGTFDFMAPEVLRCPARNNPAEKKKVPVDADPETAKAAGPQYGTAADAWGVGVLVYAMLTGQPPFVSKRGDAKEVAAGITSSHPTLHMAAFPKLSPAARSFIRLTMAAEPADRPSVLEMQAHALLQTHAAFLRPSRQSSGTAPPSVTSPVPVSHGLLSPGPRLSASPAPTSPSSSSAGASAVPALSATNPSNLGSRLHLATKEARRPASAGGASQNSGSYAPPVVVARPTSQTITPSRLSLVNMGTPPLHAATPATAM